MYHLTKEEEKLLRSLRTPSKVQDYLDSLPFNFEEDGESCMSPRRVIASRKAHCIEGGMLAAAAFLLQGRKPLLLSLKVGSKDDQDHVVALFQENGYWGAVSKTNHAVLRYRDPVYRTVRELAMSYFNEYFLQKSGIKTMVGYSEPINLRRFGTRWITSEKDLWEMAEFIYDSPHAEAVPRANRKFLKRATLLEQRVSGISAL